MTIKPGSLYTVAISDRGTGTVKAIRYAAGIVDAVIMHGQFKNRTVPGRMRVDGDFLCFYLMGEGVRVSPLELAGDDDRQCA